MKKAIADKWIKALKSGKYKQGVYALKSEDNYCCLGVLCDIAIKEDPSLGRWQSGAFFTKDNAFIGGLPPAVMRWSGVKNDGGVIPKKVSTHFNLETLAGLNDSGKYSFKDIAKVIKRYWRYL